METVVELRRFEKMVTVYSSRPADELKDVYKKIMTAYGKKAEL